MPVKLSQPRCTELKFDFLLKSLVCKAYVKVRVSLDSIKEVYARYSLPHPPLEVQREIVAEIEAYQKVIDGARAVVENYTPHKVTRSGR